MPLPSVLAEGLETLAGQVSRARFPAPAGFSDAPIAFHTMGLGRSRRWLPKVPNGRTVLAVAPFLNGRALDSIRGLAWGEGHLVGRREELDTVADASLSRWDEVRVLADTVLDEPGDETSSRPSGLHAKIIAVEHGWDVTWLVGSANLTAPALEGRNVEIMAEISGRKSRVGISQFLDGFDKLCETYRRPDETAVDADEEQEGQRDVEAAARALAEADLAITCVAAGERWEWRLDGQVRLPEGVTAHVWPVSVGEEQAIPADFPVTFLLPMTRLDGVRRFRRVVRRPRHGTATVRAQASDQRRARGTCRPSASVADRQPRAPARLPPGTAGRAGSARSCGGSRRGWGQLPGRGSGLRGGDAP